MIQIYACLVVFFAISFLWAKLWISTCKHEKISGFILREIIFIVLSPAICYVMMMIIFSPVDDSYNGANKGALGFLFILWLVIFGSASFIALVQTVGDMINKDSENNNDDK